MRANYYFIRRKAEHDNTTCQYNLATQKAKESIEKIQNLSDALQDEIKILREKISILKHIKNNL